MAEKTIMDHNEAQISARATRRQITLVFLTWFASLFAAAQGTTSGHFGVIHDFRGGKDGAYPLAGLTIDRSGNLYGTALAGGRGTCLPSNTGCGTVFELTNSLSGWILEPLYAFRGGNDGAGPYGRVVIGPNGSLYGTTIDGGRNTCLSGCGVVFELKPAACASVPCPWTETILYRFRGNNDGFYPSGDLVFDQAGDLYGTTTQGGSQGPGTVYELTPSDRNWAESILYNFPSQGPGNPCSGVIFDHAGNLYGTATAPNGAIFQLTHSISGWMENTVYTFQGNRQGSVTEGGLILGESGNLIGATAFGGPENGGTVYSLRPSKDGWDLRTLYGFAGQGESGPMAQLTMDAARNLYGTTKGNPAAGTWGTVFKLTHNSSGWTETVLHRFTGGRDGGSPNSNLVFDNHGNLYGTTSAGGVSNYGVVFEITP
jgi:uncharacterized repeat protein (TIGR03803 family)